MEILQGSIDWFIINSLKSPELKEYLTANPLRWTDLNKITLMLRYMNIYDAQRMYMDMFLNSKDKKIKQLADFLIAQIDEQQNYDIDKIEQFYHELYKDEIISGSVVSKLFNAYVPLPIVYNVGDIVELKTTCGSMRYMIARQPIGKFDADDNCYIGLKIPCKKMTRAELTCEINEEMLDDKLDMCSIKKVDERQLCDYEMYNYHNLLSIVLESNPQKNRKINCFLIDLSINDGYNKLLSARKDNKLIKDIMFNSMSKPTRYMIVDYTNRGMFFGGDMPIRPMGQYTRDYISITSVAISFDKLLEILEAMQCDSNQIEKYVLKRDKQILELLNTDGYFWIHRPGFAMKGSSRELITFYPTTQTIVDAGRLVDENITAKEFCKQYNGEQNIE